MNNSWKNEYGEVKNGVLKTLIIHRKNWIRGDDAANSALTTEDGLHCCIGFMGLACNVPNEVMIGIGAVSDLPNIYAQMMVDDPSSGENVDILNEAYQVNDDSSLSEKEREKAITNLFKDQYNVKVIFKD